MAKSCVTPLIKELSSSDAEKRKRAVEQIEQLARHELTDEEGLEALSAAASDWSQYNGLDPSHALAAAVSSKIRDCYLARMAEDFPRYSERARARIVRGLAERGDLPAATTYFKIVNDYIDSGALVASPLIGFVQSREATTFLLSKLLRRVGPNPLGYHIQLLALKAAQTECAARELCANYAGPTVETYRALRERMQPLEDATHTDWIWAGPYAAERPHVCLLLDLMGYLPGEQVTACLNEALSSRDPKLQYFAVLSLLRHGQDVPAEVVETVAASAEVRNWFYDGLAVLGRRDLFPARFATQEALAESDMVEWLIYPTELERAPHHIELMGTFENPKGTERCYLFRFRTLAPHWAAKDGWMAGLSGPFDVPAMPTTNAGGSTFSKFDDWFEKTPVEHAEGIAGLISEHWTQRTSNEAEISKVL